MATTTTAVVATANEKTKTNNTQRQAEIKRLEGLRKEREDRDRQDRDREQRDRQDREQRDQQDRQDQRDRQEREQRDRYQREQREQQDQYRQYRGQRYGPLINTYSSANRNYRTQNFKQTPRCNKIFKSHSNNGLDISAFKNYGILDNVKKHINLYKTARNDYNQSGFFRKLTITKKCRDINSHNKTNRRLHCNELKKTQQTSLNKALNQLIDNIV